jgi:hypothetical protein
MLAQHYASWQKYRMIWVNKMANFLQLIKDAENCLKTCCLPLFNDPKAKGKDGESGHFQMLGGERQANDGNREQRSQKKVQKRQFQAGQQYPDDIHDDGHTTAGRLGFTDFLSEWRQAENGQFETLDSERNANDSDTQQDSAEDIGKGDEKPAEYEPQNVKQ